MQRAHRLEHAALEHCVRVPAEHARNYGVAALLRQQFAVRQTGAVTEVQCRESLCSSNPNTSGYSPREVAMKCYLLHQPKRWDRH